GLFKHFKKLDLKTIIFSTVLFLLPFVHYIVEQFLLDFPDIQRILRFSNLKELLDYSGNNMPQSDGFFSGFVAIWNAIFILGPQRMSQFTSMQLPIGGNLIILVHFLLVLLYLTGSIIQFKHAKQQMKMNLIFIGLIFVLIMELVLLRPFTPFYMLLSITPFVAGLLAIGSYGLFKKLNFNYLYLLAVIVLSIAFLPTVALYKTMKKDQINLGPVRNVQVAAPKNWQTREKTIDVVSIIDSEKIAQLICETDSTTIHGPLAVVLDYTSAVILELFCQSHQLYLGGYTDTNSKHLFFMHRSFWKKTKLQPEQWVTDSWGMTTQFDHLPIAKRLEIAPFDDYVHPPRISTDKPATQIFSYRFKTQRNAYLSITNMLPFYFRVKVIKVSANQFEQNSLMKNVGNTLYFCNECKTEEVLWQLEIETNNQSVLDINSLYW
ncbi:MAG: hypothetical protein L3J52_08900, partial [Proteobacteria bacterium]|nr:hypothetical protein [Pseudomonadota bacterium]